MRQHSSPLKANSLENKDVSAEQKQKKRAHHAITIVANTQNELLIFYQLCAVLIFLNVSSSLFQVCYGQLSAPKTRNFKCNSDGCCDQHEWCRFWASIGECRSNMEWMNDNCQIACASCRRSHTPQLALPHPPPRIQPKSQTSSSREHSLKQPVQNQGTVQRGKVRAGNGGSCAQIAENPESAAEQLTSSGLLQTIEDVSSRQTLSLDDITRAVSSGCVPELTLPECSRLLCFHLAYRSMDGSCNNLKRPLLGASFRAYLRHLPAQYEDASNIRRPTPREASRLLLASSQMNSHEQLNSLVMQWGQFISHDMARTTLHPTANCGTCDVIPSKCIPVTISSKDTNDAFRQKVCLKISRSVPVCGTGNPSRPREQLNENTAFVDGSQIYGSSNRDLQKFRDGRTGMLKMSSFNNLLVLPFDESRCTSLSSCAASFSAAISRFIKFLGLSSMHILFAREHNRIVRALQNLNSAWSGDRLFQEARKIVGAQIQVILYHEFLPRILGSSFERLIGPYRGYDPQVDPSVSNEFTTSAYRFGHGMILLRNKVVNIWEQYPRLSENGQPIVQGSFIFGDGIFKSQKILFEGGIDPILRGLWNTPLKKPHGMTPSITERMFGSTDLGSLNIMRGRDHGIPSYNKWRQFCGMEHIGSFDLLNAQVSDENLRKTLAAIYTSPDDLDLYVGGMLEDSVIGGLVGPTLACIIGDQFKRTRDGDRLVINHKIVHIHNEESWHFYFSTTWKRLKGQGNMARILCDNGDRISQVPVHAFMLPQSGGLMEQCGGIARIDLTKWRE
ncbi:ShKT domain-containing protein [Meloidogyne graminicola]|uniref:peroxidase n=1 Tax=Meloidogyne graminicola TaxID=189291 RepID=A0A8S9ZFA5_9BILA|nr:ShKT domain-containing protein [Meloidogyne graminicola]